jgi:hypothetical protein
MRCHTESRFGRSIGARRPMFSARMSTWPRGVLFSSNPRGNNEEGLSDDRYACFFDLDTWRDYVTSADFEEVGHYYRPPGPPKLWPMTEGALAQLGSGNHGADFLKRKELGALTSLGSSIG